jgi:HK97 family phage portal protein
VKVFKPVFQAARGMARLALRSLSESQKALLSKYVNEWDYGSATSAGVPINERQGLKQDTVYTSIKRIADATAMTPLPVYETLDRGRQKARRHRNYRLLNTRSNPRMTAYAWKHLSVVHLLGWGNSFSFIERDNGSRPLHLWPLHPEQVRIEGTSQGELIYGWYPSVDATSDGAGLVAPDTGGRRLYRASEILHIRGLSFDGVIGCSPILQLKELVGRSRAREEFSSRFYANGAHLGGVVTTPLELTEAQIERNRKSFDATYKGPRNAGKILFLEGADRYQAIGFSPKDQEYVNSSKLDASKIAAAFGVPLQLLNDTSATNRATVEQLFKEFLLLGLDPVFSNIEAQINTDLFTEAEQETLYAEFLRESLIEADTATLIEALSKQVLSGILSPNEARELLNRNPQAGGDELLFPVNMLPASQLGQPRQVSLDNAGRPTSVTLLDAPASEERQLDSGRKTRSLAGRNKIIKSSRALMVDAFKRIGDRERRDVLNRAKKELRALRTESAFKQFLLDYYADDSAFSKFLRKTISPVADSLASSLRGEIADELDNAIEDDGAEFTSEYVNILVLRYAGSSRKQLEAILRDAEPGAELTELIEERLNEWESGTSEDNPPRAEKDAQNESRRMGNALSRLFYTAAGVTVLKWRANPGACPLCQEMDGRTAGIRGTFAGKGDTIEGEGTAPLTTDTDIFAPPLHGGCECDVVPD